MSGRSGERQVFVTGGTGYMGRDLIGALMRRGHAVRALVRGGSEKKLPDGCPAVIGDALDDSSYRLLVAPADTFVHLIGVPSPNPTKGAEFRAVDLASVRAAVAVAVEARIQHFVYVSVAQPAPAMKAYVQVRMECEEIIRSSGLNATILRPWYVLGPHHRWPYALIPVYWLLERLPVTREGAQRLGLVTIRQMLAALVNAVENPCRGIRIVTVPEIRNSSR